jgi:hypothetical protein
MTGIDRRYGTPFAASTSISLSKYVQPAQAHDGMGPASSYTGSLVDTIAWAMAVLRLVSLLKKMRRLHGYCYSKTRSVCGYGGWV